MPDHYRPLDQLRSLPTYLRDLPQTARAWPVQLREPTAQDSARCKQVGLGLALLGTVTLAQHAVPRGSPGAKKSPGEMSWTHENSADGQPRLILDNENAAKPERAEYKVLTD